MSERFHLPETTSFVLSVNDSPNFNRDRYLWLRDRGAVVIRANSTAAALAHLASGVPVDVIITNLRRTEGGRPQNTAGIDLTAAVRQAGYQTPVMLYSMNMTPQLIQQAKSAGVTHLVTGDMDLRRLLMKYV